MLGVSTYRVVQISGDNSLGLSMAILTPRSALGARLQPVAWRCTVGFHRRPISIIEIGLRVVAIRVMATSAISTVKI